MTKCKNCGKPTDHLRTVAQNGQILRGCDLCITQVQQGHEGASKFDREWQKKQYRRELTQPNDKSYAKAYPEKAREEWGDNTFRKYA
jgi:hypothetical protein